MSQLLKAFIFIWLSLKRFRASPLTSRLRRQQTNFRDIFTLNPIVVDRDETVAGDKYQ